MFSRCMNQSSTARTVIRAAALTSRTQNNNSSGVSRLAIRADSDE